MCINFRKRCKKHKTIFYCKEKRREITLENCKNCSKRTFKVNKPIKAKSKKSAKLERQRDKEIVKSGICEYCGKFSERLDPHEVYGGSNRKRSILNGFVKRICRKCHSNEEVIKQLKIDVQKEFEQNHTRVEFIAIVGKSYL